MRVLHIATAGSKDPTRASIPLHLAANGSLEEGQDCALALVGDATELVARAAADVLIGVGIPPVKDLLAKLIEHGVPVYVWKGCAVARGATDEDLEWLKAKWLTPPELARMVGEYDRVVSF